MDADAYGPNVPRMMGVQQLPRPSEGKIAPAEAFGVRLVSIGFMVSAETPLVWRGPMTDKMVRQFLKDVDWGELDLLVVDLPPTTGDVPLSLVEDVQVDGAIVVSELADRRWRYDGVFLHSCYIWPPAPVYCRKQSDKGAVRAQKDTGDRG